MLRFRVNYRVIVNLQTRSPSHGIPRASPSRVEEASTVLLARLYR